MLLASVVLTNVLTFNLVGDRTTYGTYGIVFWGDAALLTAVYLLVARARELPAQATEVAR